MKVVSIALAWTQEISKFERIDVFIFTVILGADFSFILVCGTLSAHVSQLFTIKFFNNIGKIVGHSIIRKDICQCSLIDTNWNGRKRINDLQRFSFFVYHWLNLLNWINLFALHT